MNEYCWTQHKLMRLMYSFCMHVLHLLYIELHGFLALLEFFYILYLYIFQ